MRKKLVMMTLASCILASAFSLTVCAEPVEAEAGVIFDAEYYAETNPDVVNDLGDDEDVLYEHYKLYSASEGRHPYTPKTSQETLEKSKKAKKVKKVKTKQKLDEEMIKFKNERKGFEYWVKYGIYSDENIDAQVKAFNKYRKDKKLPAMKNNTKLNKAAAMIAMEYTIGYNFDKNGDKVYGMRTNKRPDGTSYSTAIKECGVKCKSSSIIVIDFAGGYTGFIDTVVNDYSSIYGKLMKSKKYTEYGIGYYSANNGSRQIWVLIPISK